MSYFLDLQSLEDSFLPKLFPIYKKRVKKINVNTIVIHIFIPIMLAAIPVPILFEDKASESTINCFLFILVLIDVSSLVSFLIKAFNKVKNPTTIKKYAPMQSGNINDNRLPTHIAPRVINDVINDNIIILKKDMFIFFMP